MLIVRLNSKKIFRTLLCVCVFSSAGIAIADVDVMHFWVSPSERDALDVFADSYRANGGNWVDDKQEDHSTLKRNAIERISNGYPPTAMQWVVSHKLFDLVSAGVLTSFDEDQKPEALSQLHPLLLDIVTRDSKISAIPVSIHAENWAFYNAKIIRELNLQPAKNWEQMFEHMAVIEKAGYLPIAMSESSWEHDHIFKSMLVAEGGIPLVSAIDTGSISKTLEGKLQNSLEHFIKLRDIFQRIGYKAESWSLASKAVIEGRAAIQLMGDWAKGEMMNAGAVPGKDFLCAMAPGNEEVYLAAIDVFVLPKLVGVKNKRTQEAFIDVILNKKNQMDFSEKKRVYSCS